MSYINRVWVATSVAVVNSHSDQLQKLKSGLRSLNHGKNRFFSGDLRWFSVVNSDLVGGFSNEAKLQRADESVRQVMYLNCWGQS